MDASANRAAFEALCKTYQIAPPALGSSPAAANRARFQELTSVYGIQRSGAIRGAVRGAAAAAQGAVGGKKREREADVPSPRKRQAVAAPLLLLLRGLEVSPEAERCADAG